MHTEKSIHEILNITTEGTPLNDYLQKKLEKMTKDLLKLAPDMISLNIHLTESPGDIRAPRKVRGLLALPGIDLHAVDSGYQWKLLIKHVEIRLKKSITKRKELMRKQAKENPVLAQLDPAA